MAKVKMVKKPTYKMILSEDEATWLKGMVQNPLNDPNGQLEEDSRDRKIRKAIFEALAEHIKY